MTVALARAVFFVIWGAGVVAWALGLRRSLSLLQQPLGSQDWGGGGDFEDESDPGSFTGELEVEGRPSAVQQEVEGRLPEVLGPYFALRRSAMGLELRNGRPPTFSQVGWSNVSQARLAFRSAGLARTCVSYECDVKELRRKLGRIALTVVLAAGVPTLVVVGALIWLLVVPNESPAARWQVFQTAQVVHALWPPFMIVGKLKANVREVESSLRALVEASGGVAGE